MNPTQHINPLQKPFLEEWHSKIGATKETRFNTKKRLLTLARRSNRCQRFLLVYFIVAYSWTVYSLFMEPLYSKNEIIYSVIVVSLLFIVFNRYHSTAGYDSKAKECHHCEEALTSLHNITLVFKTIGAHQTPESKRQFTEKLARSYDAIIKNHQNYEPIGVDLFTSKAAVDCNLKWFPAQTLRLKHYLSTALGYHLLIAVPPVVVFLLFYK
jgi:hypothetical protein